MDTERLNAQSSDGRRVAVWRTAPYLNGNHQPVIVLNAGFGRRIRDVGSIALCLAMNGCTVYRFDSLDHVGLSDGSVEDFSIDAVVRSLEATIELALAAENVKSVRATVLSFSTLAALKLASESAAIDRLIAISGVINGRRTLETAVGLDYTDVAISELPPRIEIEGCSVNPRHLRIEHEKTASLSLETTSARLQKIHAPVINCVASRDPWVDIEDCQKVFSGTQPAERLILELPFEGHELGGNPAAIRLVLDEVTKLAIGQNDLAEDLETGDIRFPGFDELLEVRVAERERAKAEERADCQGPSHLPI